MCLACWGKPLWLAPRQTAARVALRLALQNKMVRSEMYAKLKRRKKARYGV